MQISEILGKTQMLTQNDKLKKTSKYFGVKVYNFSIPAYKSNTGKIICPFAGSCLKFCYAQKGRYNFSNVKQALEKRYQVTKHKDFVSFMVYEITRLKIDFLRLHDSGDFYSPEYRNNWFQIMESLPNVKFYAYTKSFPLFVNTNIPENFSVIFSQGSKLDGKFDVTNYRHSRIFKNEDELNKAGYINASKYDLFASKWFSDTNNIGLIFH